MMGNHHGRHSNPGRRKNNPPPPYNYGPYSENSAPTNPTPIGNSNMGLRLPYGHVDSSLRAVAGQAEGFGRFAVGGLHGAVYLVTTLAGKRIITMIVALSLPFFLILLWDVLFCWEVVDFVFWMEEKGLCG